MKTGDLDIDGKIDIVKAPTDNGLDYTNQKMLTRDTATGEVEMADIPSGAQDLQSVLTEGSATGDNEIILDDFTGTRSLYSFARVGNDFFLRNNDSSQIRLNGAKVSGIDAQDGIGWNSPDNDLNTYGFGSMLIGTLTSTNVPNGFNTQRPVVISAGGKPSYGAQIVFNAFDNDGRMAWRTSKSNTFDDWKFPLTLDSNDESVQRFRPTKGIQQRLDNTDFNGLSRDSGAVGFYVNQAGVGVIQAWTTTPSSASYSYSENDAVAKIENDGSFLTDGKINLGSYTNTSPSDGDLWFDGTDLKFRVGGVTKTVTLT